MSNEAAINIALRLVDQATTPMNRAMGMIEKSTSAAEKQTRMVGAAAKFVASAFAAIQVGQFVKDAAMLAARYDTLGVAMRTVGAYAGYTGTQMSSFQAGLEKTGISMIESRNNLTKMAQAQIDLAQSSHIARIAQDAAVIGGINSSEAFQRMIHGIQSGQIEVLRTIGINVNFENSYKKLAGELGKTSAALSENEKMQARVNVVMDAGAKIAGTYEAAMGTAGKQLLSLDRYSENLKVKLGAVFNDALIVGVLGLTGALKNANAEADQLAANQTIAAWGKGLVYTMAAVADAIAFPFKVVAQVIEAVIATGARVIKFFEMIENATSGNFKAAKRNWQELGEIGEQYSKSTADRWTNSYINSTNQMYSSRAENAAKDAALLAENEKKMIAAGEAARALAKKTDAAALAATKAAADAKKLGEEWKRTAATLDKDMAMSGLTGLEKELKETTFEAEKLRAEFGKVDGALAKIDAWEKQAKAIATNRDEVERLIKQWDLYAENQEQKKAIQEAYDDVILNMLTGEALAVALVTKEYEKKAEAIEQAITSGQVDPAVGAAQITDMGLGLAKKDLDRYKESLDAIVNTDTSKLAAFADPLTEGIGKVVTAMDRWAIALEDQAKAEKALGKIREDVQNLPDGAAKAEKMIKLQKAEADLAQNSTALQLSGLRELAGTTSLLFKENSREREAFHKIEMTLGAIELAMKLKTMAADAAKTVDSLANSAMRAGAYALEAIAAAFASGPWVGFAAGAAMIGIMAGLGLGRGSGGSSTAPTMNTGTGTILGDPAATSQSAQKSWDMLEEFHDLEYHELRGIHNSMKELNQNITGLVSSVLRSTGVDGFSVSVPDGEYGLARSLFDTVAKGLDSVFDWVFGESLGKYVQLFTTGFISPILKAVGWLVGGIFGGKTSYSQTGGGLAQRAPITAKDLLAGAGIDLDQFATIKTEVDGGWFRSDKTYYDTQYSDADTEVTKLFTTIFKDLSSTLVFLTEGLGGDVNRALSQAFDIGKIDLKGKTTDEINEALSAVISAAGDTAIKNVLGDIVGMYQQANEGLLETAVRLLVGKEVVIADLTRNGQRLESNLVATTQAMIDMAGGLDKLQESSRTYYENFHTDEEKHLDLMNDLTAVLGMMGQSLPATRDAYRGLVESIDLTAESGQRLYVSLMSLSEGANAYYDTVEENLEKIIALEEDLAKTRLAAVTDAESALKTAYNTEAGVFQQTIDQFGRFTTELRKFKDSLLMGSLSILNPVEKYATASQQFDDISRLARLGDATAIEQLSSVSQSFLEASKGVYASSDQYLADFARVISVVDVTAGVTDRAASVAQQQLDALTTQVSAMITLNDSVLSVRDAVMALSGARIVAGLPVQNSFAVGTDYVPYDMVAKIHKGERITPAAYNRGDSTNAALLNELQALRKEVQELRKDQAKFTGAQIGATAQALDKTADKIVAGSKDEKSKKNWGSNLVPKAAAA